MQKELKILDEELTSNNLVRVTQTNFRSDKSLFKSISLSVFYTEEKFEQVIGLLKSCAFSFSRDSKNNAFPQAHSKVKFIENFRNEQVFQLYYEQPDLNCFAQDNMELASIAYGRRVILYTISQDGYLQEQLVTSCTGKKAEPPIMLARISKRYFCVQSQLTRSIITFIKENIINHFLNSESKIHYPNFEANEKVHRRQHKKSLSDCDINMNFDQQQMYEGRFGEGSDREFNNEITHNLKENSMSEYYYPYHQNSYGYDVGSNLMGQDSARFDRGTANIVPNQRYTGRLKFFDQNGNYGFIVVDGINADLFIHYDDLSKAGIAKDRLLNIRNSEEMRFEFMCLQYDGKYKKSKKAVDLVLLPQN